MADRMRRVDRPLLERLARKRITEASPELVEPIVARIVDEALKDVPSNRGIFDETSERAWYEHIDKVRIAEETYFATVAEQQGVGSVRGVGHTLSGVVTEADVDRAVAEAFGRELTSERDGTRETYLRSLFKHDLEEARYQENLQRVLSSSRDLTLPELDEALGKISRRTPAKEA